MRRHVSCTASQSGERSSVECKQREMNITRLHSPTPLDPSAAAERSIASYPQASPTTPKPTRTLPGPHHPTRSQLGRQVEMTHAQFMQLKKTIDQLNVSDSLVLQNNLSSCLLAGEGETGPEPRGWAQGRPSGLLTRCSPHSTYPNPLQVGPKATAHHQHPACSCWQSQLQSRRGAAPAHTAQAKRAPKRGQRALLSGRRDSWRATSARASTACRQYRRLPPSPPPPPHLSRTAAVHPRAAVQARRRLPPS